MTLPASVKSATARSFLSAMLAKDDTGLGVTVGAGGAADTARPTPNTTSALARANAIPFILAASRRAGGADERKRVHPLARELRPGVGDGRRDRRHARLADAGGAFLAGDDVHLDRRHLVDAQHAVIVEVRLHHAAVVE